jgi:hypothetical protein
MENIQKYRKEFYLINKIYLFLFQLLIFLMLFMPRNIQEIKTIIIAILFFIVVIRILQSGKINLNRYVQTYLAIFLSYGILSSFIGFWRSNPGVLGFSRVNIIYFILLALLIEPIKDIKTFEKIIKVLILSSNAIAIYSIILLLVKNGIWPESLFVEFDVTSRVGLHQGYTHLVNTNLSMMIFLAPMITILLGENYSSKLINKKYLVFSEVLIIIAVIISGRRILWICLGIPIFILLFNIFGEKKIGTKCKRFLLSAFLIIFILFFINYFELINFTGLANRFLSAFTTEENVRLIQASALWKGFSEYPFLGSGAGSGLSNYVRSSKNIWAYELSYNSILYHSGLIGITIYFTSMFYLLMGLWKRTKITFSPKTAKAMLVSFVTALIANATNPYFSSSFDFLLFIFIPLMYMNLDSSE